MQLRKLALLLSLVAVAPSAEATPVLHDVQAASSTVRAVLAATMAYTIVSNYGTVSGSLNANNLLQSGNETGTVNLDWGSPGWSSHLAIAPGDLSIHSGAAGYATASVTPILFGLLVANFELTVVVDDISLDLASNFDAATNPLDPAGPGAGPWSGTAFAGLQRGMQVDIYQTGPFGFSSVQNDVVVGGQPASNVLFALELSRLGGNPGVGSRIDFDVPVGLALAMPTPSATTYAVPGCEVAFPLFGCNLDVTSVTVQLTSLTLSDLDGSIAATSSTPVPEPTTLTLFSVGLLGVAAQGRRRRPH